MMAPSPLYPFLLLLALVMTGCHTRNAVVPPSSSPETMTEDEGPQILFLKGTIAFDSVASAYRIAIDSQQRFSGRMNTEGAACTGTPHGLYYQQADERGEILSQHEIDNPLEQRIEYFDGSQPVTKTIRRDQADLFVRLPLNPRARYITFLYESLKITTITLK